MGREDLGPISQYNSLTDPYLQGYYSKSIIRNHLKQTGLINRKGEIIPEEIWRKRIATKERMEQASRIIANRIVKQAIEIKNLEKAELRTAMDILAKKELVRRIRGKSIESRNPPRLWPDQNNYQTRDSEDKRIYSTLQRDEPRIDSIEDDQDYGRRYNTYVQRERSRSRPKHRRRIDQRSRSKKGRSQFKRSFSAAPKQEAEPITVTMLYYGKGINIPFDTQVFDSRDEISVYQQHCGGENLLVYTGLVEPGKKFNFVSRRHKEYPFSLTIFINGTYDCRISTCCEYKHKLNIRIGGPSGRFAVTNVTGKNPCIKCLMEKAAEEKKRQRKNKKNRSVEKEYDSEFEDDKKERTTTKKNQEASRKVSRSSSISSEKPPVEIPIRHLNDSDSDSYSPKQDSPKNKANGTRKSSWSSKSSSDEKVKSQRYHKDDVINVIEGRKSETKGSKHSQSSASDVPSSSSSAASTARSDKDTKTTTAAATIVNAVKSKRSSESSKSSKSSISDSKSSLNSSSSRDKAKKTNVVESKPPLSTKKASSKSSSSDIFSSDDDSKASTPKNNDSKRSTPVAKSPSFMDKVEKKIENLSNNILGTEKGRSSKLSSRSETPTTPTRNKSPSTPKRNKSPSTPTKQDNPSVMVKSNKPNKKASSPASSRDRSVTPTTPTRNKSPSTPTRNKSPSSPTKQDNPSVMVKSNKPNKKASPPLFSGDSSSSDESIFDTALNKKNHPEKEKSTTNTTKANEEQTKLPSRLTSSSSSSSSSSSTPSSTARSEKKEAEKPKENNVSSRDALENARKSSSSRSSNRSFGSENRYSPTVRNNENRNTYSPSHMRNS